MQTNQHRDIKPIMVSKLVNKCDFYITHVQARERSCNVYDVLFIVDYV
jgi:hypothetical protein